MSFSAAVKNHLSLSGEAGNRARTTTPKPADINPFGNYKSYTHHMRRERG